MYTIEELIDLIQQDLTVGCALPKLLPDTEIRRIVETKAMPWFFQNYQYAVQKMYYFLSKDAWSSDEWTKYKYLKLPCEIQTVTWIYTIRDTSLFTLGINAPNLSINMGVTNQPYLSSYVTTIGDLGVYKALLDSFGDMLDQFSKFTVRHHYNQMTNRLNVLTKIEGNMILEAYANVESEALFADTNFIKYTTGLAKQQLGQLMGRYDFTLPGGVKFNSEGLITEGKENVTEVVEMINGQSKAGFFFMIKR
jgi:hypothetical protein